MEAVDDADAAIASMDIDLRVQGELDSAGPFGSSPSHFGMVLADTLPPSEESVPYARTQQDHEDGWRLLVNDDDDDDDG